eukprot:Trichotokara_eunicae@DN4207_c0_g1_i1.p1
MESASTFEKYRDDMFVALNTLTEQNILEYFYGSRFFDPASLNQQRRKGQSVAPDADGVVFRLVHLNDAARNILPLPLDSRWSFPNQFGVFTIQKFRRQKGSETPLDCYYVIGGTIYKAPVLGQVVRHRLANSFDSLESLLDKLRNACAWSLTDGYSWSERARGDVDTKVKKKGKRKREKLIDTPPNSGSSTHEINSVNVFYSNQSASASERILQEEYFQTVSTGLRFGEYVRARQISEGQRITPQAKPSSFPMGPEIAKENTEAEGEDKKNRNKKKMK